MPKSRYTAAEIDELLGKAGSAATATDIRNLQRQINAINQGMTIYDETEGEYHRFWLSTDGEYATITIEEGDEE